MNCLEFRRLCLAEPTSTDAAFRRHRTACTACAAFAERQDAFERALRSAVQIEPPSDLDARVILRQTTAGHASNRRRFAFAASFLLALGTAVAFWWQSPSMEQVVLAHILDEPEHLAAQGEVPATRAARVLADVGVSLNGDLGTIRFADLCPGRPGAHLVVAGRRGPVTVLIMPGKTVSARQRVAHGRLAGVIVPIAKGSLAIVGLDGEPIEEVEQRVRAAIT